MVRKEMPAITAAEVFEAADRLADALDTPLMYWRDGTHHWREKALAALRDYRSLREVR